MRTVLFAYHDMGCVGLAALLRHGFDVAAVFTHRDDPNEAIWFESVAERAASLGISVFAPGDVNQPTWAERIMALSPDVIFSFYYRRLLRPLILDLPPRGCFNLHGSLLPRYRGRCPINWVLIAGEEETGVTLHHMTPWPDDGDIVAQERIVIARDDTARTLHEKAAQAAAVLLDRILPRIKEGTAPRTPQDPSRATYFGGRRPGDGEIDWTQSAAAVRNLVRAVTDPYPGALSRIGGVKCRIWAVSEVPRLERGEAPGTILSIDPLIVACGQGAVEVDFAEAEDGGAVSGAQLARELRLAVNRRFGPKYG